MFDARCNHEVYCNKLFSNSCLVFNLNYYKFVVLDVHTLLFKRKLTLASAGNRRVFGSVQRIIAVDDRDTGGELSCTQRDVHFGLIRAGRFPNT